MFDVEANNNETTNGFYVSICSVHEGDDFSSLDTTSAYDSSKEKGKRNYRNKKKAPRIRKLLG